MSGRDITSAVLSLLSFGQVRIAYLLKAEFDSADVRLTDYGTPLVWDSETYTAAGSLLSFSGLQETGAPLVNQITVTLSGVDTSAMMAAVLQDDFLDRRLRIWLAFIETTITSPPAPGDGDHVMADPVLIFDGRMDAPTIAEDLDQGTASVTIAGTSAWADFGRRPGRHTSNEEQQTYFAGDKGFEFVSEIPKQLTWGRA